MADPTPIPSQPPQGHGGTPPPPLPGGQGATGHNPIPPISPIPPAQPPQQAQQAAQGVPMPPQQFAPSQGQFTPIQGGATGQGGMPVPPPVQGVAPGQPPQKPPPQPPAPKGPDDRVGQLKTRKGHIFVIPPHPNTTFDDANFLELLEGSISLTMEEKQRVIDAIPRLRIEQVNELISIFEEEKQKFSELEGEFAQDVYKLKQEREKEKEGVVAKKEEEKEGGESIAEAEALKKSLGV